MYSDTLILSAPNIEYFIKYIVNVLKCSDNIIIEDLFLCAHLYGQSSVTRDPYMAWHSFSQS